MSGFDVDETIGAEGLFLLSDEGEQDPRKIAAELVSGRHEFTHLKLGDASIMFLMRAATKVKNGKAILGEMCLPQFQGSLGQLAKWLLAKVCDGVPDFIMLLDNAWWMQATPVQRRALVFHELLHADHAVDRHGEFRFTPEGMPVWGLRAHDIEEFRAVVEEYGAWLPDIESFAEAMRKGGVV